MPMRSMEQEQMRGQMAALKRLLEGKERRMADLQVRTELHGEGNGMHKLCLLQNAVWGKLKRD